VVCLLELDDDVCLVLDCLLELDSDVCLVVVCLLELDDDVCLVLDCLLELDGDVCLGVVCLLELDDDDMELLAETVEGECKSDTKTKSATGKKQESKKEEEALPDVDTIIPPEVEGLHLEILLFVVCYSLLLRTLTLHK